MDVSRSGESTNKYARGLKMRQQSCSGIQMTTRKTKPTLKNSFTGSEKGGS